MTQEALRYSIPAEPALEPPAEWGRLREECPVVRVTPASGDEAMPVTRYDDVRQVLSDPRFTRTGPGRGARVGAGAHSCIGQPLARTELQAVLDVLPRKLPSLELAVEVDDLRRVEGLVVGGLKELPVRW